MASHNEDGGSTTTPRVLAEREAGESDVQHHDDDVPKPTIREVQACQFSSWYSTFRSIDRTAATAIQEENNTTGKKIRKNVTIESIIIRPLPPDFIEYLLSDGVRLPECATKVSSCMNDSKQTVEDDRWASSSSDDEDNDNDNNSSSSTTETEPLKTYNFPTLTSQIQSALTTLGGGGNNNKGCIPKLNWSSPKDATWINCGSLKCTKVGDVYLLLKSSDFVMFDLEKAFVEGLAAEEGAGEGGENGDDGAGTQEMTNLSLNHAKPHDFEYELVLRKWCNLHPSMEFRCFVYEHELVAISQRHPSKFYPHLQPPSDDTNHNPFTTIIHAFFQTYIQRRFSNGNMHKYAVDLYLDSQERVWIVDFNVWGERTDGLLFDWNELMELGTNMHASSDSKNHNNTNDDEPRMPEVRVVTKDMKSMTYDPLSSYRGPTDVMNLMGGGKGDGSDEDLGNMPSFQEFMKQCVRPSEL